MKKRTRKKENEKNRGSLTVETALFLLPFMCAYLILINTARFVEAEVIVHHAITQTAKQISTYSYVLTKTKIVDKIQNTKKKSSKFQKNVKDTVDAVKGFTDAVGNVGTSGDILIDLDNVMNTGAAAEEALVSFFSDPKAIASGVFSVAKAAGEGAGLTLIVGALAKSSIRSSVALMSDDPNEFLEDVGIVGGMSGLDFSDSEWMPEEEGKASIQIVVTYKMKPLVFPGLEFDEYEFCQCASTLIW